MREYGYEAAMPRLGKQAGMTAEQAGAMLNRPVEVDRRSEVERALDDQAAAIDRLAGVVGELKSRLTPVMYDVPQPAQTQAYAESSTFASPLARSIAGRTDSLAILTREVEEWLSRLGI